MTRRQAIIAGLLAPVGVAKPQDIEINLESKPTVDTLIFVTIKVPHAFTGKFYALGFQYQNEIIQFTPEEVMEALRPQPWWKRLFGI